MDREFFESLLVPQSMLRGFLGFAPTADGCRIELEFDDVAEAEELAQQLRRAAIRAA